MLHELPVECLQQIIGYLPSATAIINVVLVNRALYAKISADKYGVLQYFVQRLFPTISTHLSWRDSTIALTSRSRAWDRRAIIARECYPPDCEAIQRPTNRGKQKFGYVPVIDSYNVVGSTYGSKEVVAWAAGGKVNMRSSSCKSTSWQILRFPNDHEPVNDVLELRLLRPYQCVPGRTEHLVIRCATGEVTLLKVVPDTKGHYERKDFHVGVELVDCMDVSPARQPLLALCNARTIRLYQVHDEGGTIQAREVFELEEARDGLSRQRCAKFLSQDLLAVAPQYLQGRQYAPIKLYDINTAQVANKAFAPTTTLLPRDLSARTRHGSNVLAPLDKTCGNAGQLFLSGWSDGVVRLHDTRTGKGSEISYTDKVDDGQILSLVPLGHESFLAGSHQNACLKTFDLRMPGARPYSYLNARPVTTARSTSQPRTQASSSVQRNINIFLALKLPHRQAGWKPLPLNDPPTERYRGSVYSLSSPAPSSSLVYAGIEDHVIQLDITATDDVKRQGPMRSDDRCGKHDPNGVFNLSCYERPREGYESTDTVLLRKQAVFSDAVEGDHQARKEMSGWDIRWHLATDGRRGQRERRWSRGRVNRK